MALSEVMLLRPIVCRFAADASSRTFSGYTDGRRLWNGFVCPHLPLDEFRRVLDVLLEWGDEKHYTVIDDRQVRVHGMSDATDDYVMTAKLQATTDGDRPLFDCGGAWAFVDGTSPATADVDAPPLPCTHPAHRLGTRGGLKKHQRVCLQCGAVVLARR